MISRFRIKLIKILIDLNEYLFFEMRLKKIYRNVKINTVVDVGANKGQTIDFFLKINQKCNIYAFEPNPKLFEYLTRKYKHHKNIRIYNMGISNEVGSKIFFENMLDYTSSFEPLNPDSKYLEKKAKVLGLRKEKIIKDKYPVQTITLAEFFLNNKEIKEIDILKIDTEGHELNCLIGLFYQGQLPLIHKIQIERHYDDMYINSNNMKHIDLLLSQNNFIETVAIKHGFGDFEEIIYQNNYEVKYNNTCTQ
jgi:FkbM family methyltransferase